LINEINFFSNRFLFPELKTLTILLTACSMFVLLFNNSLSCVNAIYRRMGYTGLLCMMITDPYDRPI